MNKPAAFYLMIISVFSSALVFAGGQHAHDHHHEHMSAVGVPASTKDANKQVSVTMLDTMRFEYEKLPAIHVGDVVTFKVTNQGKIPHEFSIGNQAEQDAHRAMMRDKPDMVHEDGNTITVKPGETKTLTWKFQGEGEVVFACNIPGHYEAGMFSKLTLSVTHGHH